MSAGPRYAIYYAPAEDSPLWRFGSGVIGYDAMVGEDVSLRPIDGVSADEQLRLTEDPRRYGFHATLKAPFHLDEDRSEGELLSMAQIFAGQNQRGEPFPLKVALLSRFIAVVPAALNPSIARLAASAVETFEHFRAPLSEADIARRNPTALSETQRSNLERWGYPYVFDEFRFHMTLTGGLAPGERQPMLERLTAMFATDVPEPVTSIDRIVLYKQERRDGRFRVMRSFQLAAHLD